MEPTTLAAEFPHLHAPPGGWLFVITYGRSGSTVLQAVLNTLPGYCVRGENANALTHLCRLVADLEDQDMIGPGAAAARAPSDPWYGAAAIDTVRTARRLFDAFAREILHLPAGTRVGGFKEIRYIEDMAFLPRQVALMRRYFPCSRLIFLTRAPQEVARSGWWTTWPPEDVIPEIEAANTAFADLAAADASAFLIDHAALSAGAAALAPIFHFLGEDIDPDAVQQVLDRRLNHGRVRG